MESFRTHICRDRHIEHDNGSANGEFFANSTLLAPFGHWVTGLWGEPRHAILK